MVFVFICTSAGSKWLAHYTVLSQIVTYPGADRVCPGQVRSRTRVRDCCIADALPLSYFILLLKGYYFF